jgi:hypothetical protein
MTMKSETGTVVGVLRAKRGPHGPAGQEREGGSAVADPKAQAFLRRADPILRELIDARPDFHPRAWLDELPPLDAFGTLIFQVVGQRRAVQRAYGYDHLPSEDEMDQVAERWRPYRSLAVSYLFASESEIGM